MLSIPTPLAELHPDFLATFGRPAGLWLPTIGPENKAYDLSGNIAKNVGTLNGGVTTTASGWGTLGQAWGAATKPTFSTFTMPSAAVTLLVAFSPKSLPPIPNLLFTNRAAWNSSNGAGLWSGLNNTTDLEFSVNGTTINSVAGTIAVGGKYVAVGTYDGATAKLYINGALVKSGAASGAIASSSTPLTINQATCFYSMLGAVWSSALTAAQVSQLYNCLKTGEPFPLFASEFGPALFTETKAIGSAGNVYTNNLVDTVTITEILAENANYIRSLSDTVTFTDSNLVNGIYARLLSDTITLTDANTINTIYARALSDLITLSDSVLENGQYIRALTDTVTFSEIVSETSQLLQSVADTVTFTDQVTVNAIYARALLDTVTFTDSESHIATLLRSILDTVIFSDNPSGNLVHTLAILDTITFTDTAINMNFVRLISAIRNILIGGGMDDEF